ncbi:MAG: RagB/SusD family nutrient uptake outer membrane protein [Dysgonamonadaceae bacterium]|nr:RagB/SusD family nutrient uptake outer membrane protein [Dysgonamonadaceae bacterium]
MKNFVKSFFLLIFILLGFACSDFLDPNTDNTMTEEEVFDNAAYFCGPLMDVYNALPDYFNIEMDNMTDNSVDGKLSGDYYLCGIGALRPDYNPLDNWTNAYLQIRRINQFLKKMVLNPSAVVPTPVRFYAITTPQDSIDNVREFYRLYGEAYFLRALWLSDLLKNFGGVAPNGQVLGVPLVGDRELNVTDDLNIPRASYADCVQAIVNDCDTAAKYLPVEYKGTDRVTGQSMNGRASGISAMALKARVLLYAASPAFNPENRKELWENAAIAAGNAIKAVGGGFQDLVNAPTNEIGGAYYFNQLQDKTWNDNGKDLFFRSIITSGNRDYETNNYPQSMYGSAVTNPSQNFVDAFPDKNGYPIFENGATYSENNPFAGRDPRLALYVAFNGSQMGPGNYHTIESYEGGIDAYMPLKKTSRTSYYLRKLVRPGTVSLIPGSLTGTTRAYIILGKPELYLNYAEAANEAWGVKQDPKGFGFSAYSVLQRIHKKYGSGDQYLNNVIGESVDKFRSYIHNERRLELSFEGHYYYDLRRWVSDKSTNSINTDVYGMEITKNADNTFSYKRKFLEKKDFKSPYQPIPYMELYNAPSLVQNYGWE